MSDYIGWGGTENRPDKTTVKVSSVDMPPLRLCAVHPDAQLCRMCILPVGGEPLDWRRHVRED